MAVYAKTDRPVPSLFKTCTRAVVENLSHHEDDLEETPLPVKRACLHLMSKRGLLTDENIAKLVFDKLRVLDLSSSEVSDAGLINLSPCRNLYKVDLNANNNCRQTITSEGVVSLSRSSPHLRVVYLRRCVELTDEGVVALSENCPLLQELNVGGCVNLTDASLVALGHNSRHLASFNFSKARVTDTGVYSLVSGVCSDSLKEMDMNGCVGLTDEAVEAVLQLCPHIRILIFHGCPRITENARMAFEELMQQGSFKMKQITFTVY